MDNDNWTDIYYLRKDNRKKQKQSTLTKTDTHLLTRSTNEEEEKLFNWSTSVASKSEKEWTDNMFINDSNGL